MAPSDVSEEEIKAMEDALKEKGLSPEQIEQGVLEWLVDRGYFNPPENAET